MHAWITRRGGTSAGQQGYVCGVALRLEYGDDFGKGSAAFPEAGYEDNSWRHQMSYVGYLSDC